MAHIKYLGVLQKICVEAPHPRGSMDVRVAALSCTQRRTVNAGSDCCYPQSLLQGTGKERCKDSPQKGQAFVQNEATSALKQEGGSLSANQVSGPQDLPKAWVAHPFWGLSVLSCRTGTPASSLHSPFPEQQAPDPIPQLAPQSRTVS